MENPFKIIIVALLLFFAIDSGLLAYGTSSAAIAGIRVTHNGKPIDNLEVRVYFTSAINNAEAKIYTTDGTGFVTISVTHNEIFDGGSILYDFGFNGTTYSFSEPLTQIVEVSV